jgi:uncharacterized alpha/beta hydrolase family protein
MAIDLPKPWYRRMFFFILVIIALLIVSGVAAKGYLYVKFLLGNDIAVKLSTDKEVLSLQRGQQELITFKASVTTNPFCTAECTAIFSDISSNMTIEAEQFTLRAAIPYKKEYAIQATRHGTGQDLYSFKMECRSTPTRLCHTTGDATTRTLLITVNRELSIADEQSKAIAKERIDALNRKLSLWNGMINTFSMIDIAKIPFDVNALPPLQNRTKALASYLSTLQEPWKGQTYETLLPSIDVVEKEFTATETDMISLNNSVNIAFMNYNAFNIQLQEARNTLEAIKSDVIIVNASLALELHNMITEFNQAATYYDVRTAGIVIDRIKALNISIRKDYRRETLRRSLELDRESDALCSIAKTCTTHPTIADRAAQTTFELGSVCGDITKLSNEYLDLNESIADDVRNANYSNTKSFWDLITIKVRNLKQNITDDYRKEIPQDQPNTALLNEILIQKPLVSTNGLQGDIKLAMLVELVRQRPKACEIQTITTPTVSVAAESTTAPTITPALSSVPFEEPAPICCVYGACRSCCTTFTCKNDPATYPVLMLHGHAFYQALSAEYNLDIFNKLQNRLEEEGYVNAGAITLYTTHDTPSGDWGISGSPLTIKVSYYFDLFKQPENYVVVQANSENVDTYAIRLKELIDTVSYKTGKPKVIIIAHSMGGLVTRRYMQIFGSDKIEKVILIGTPNKGLVGNILDYCPLIGEKLECRDMNADSLFLNKLNREKIPDIPIYNIVGTGCQMKQGIGDGVVLAENAKLDGAQNIIINGTCGGIDILHTAMLLNIQRYPDVYAVIKEALKGNITG